MELLRGRMFGCAGTGALVCCEVEYIVRRRDGSFAGIFRFQNGPDSEGGKRGFPD